MGSTDERYRLGYDERYSRDTFAYGTSPNDFLASVASKFPSNSKILCIGEGEGRNGVWLAKQESSRHVITAIDSSKVGLEKCRRWAEENGVIDRVHIIHGDLNDYVIESNTYDVIISIFIHLPPPLREKVHSGCLRGLKKNGFFVLEAYSPKQLGRCTGGPQLHELLYTCDMLKADLPSIQFEILREVERDVFEGEFHTGSSSVVQVLGRKMCN